MKMQTEQESNVHLLMLRVSKSIVLSAAKFEDWNYNRDHKIYSDN